MAMMNAAIAMVRVFIGAPLPSLVVPVGITGRR